MGRRVARDVVGNKFLTEAETFIGPLEVVRRLRQIVQGGTMTWQGVILIALLGVPAIICRTILIYQHNEQGRTKTPTLGDQ